MQHLTRIGFLIVMTSTAYLSEGQLSIDRLVNYLDQNDEKPSAFRPAVENASWIDGRLLLRTKTFERQFDPFFCKIEAGIERQSGLLVKFRLGSVDYVDRLEGKRVPDVLPGQINNYFRPYYRNDQKNGDN